MKKLQLIVALSLVLILGVKSQTYIPFPTANASWNIYRVTGVTEQPSDTFILKYSLSGDTTINSITYHKINETIGNSTNAEFIGGLRELNKKVYYFSSEQNKELLLCDFTVRIGDTIRYDSGASNYSIVNGIDSIQIDGNYRKRYKIDQGSDSDYIVEGIGSVQKGLLDRFIARPTCTCYNYSEFLCFTDNGDVKYLNPSFSDCNSTKHIAGITTTSDNDFTIYPNPTKKQLYIENKTGKQNLQIKVINIQGETLSEKALNSTLDLNVDPGIYNIQILDKQGKILHTEKIIKN